MAISAQFHPVPEQVMMTPSTKDVITAIAEADSVSRTSVIRDGLAETLEVRLNRSSVDLRTKRRLMAALVIVP